MHQGVQLIATKQVMLHQSFLSLAPTMQECYKRYERFCQKYLHHSKGALKCHWGSRMLKRLVEKGSSKKKRVSPGQQQLPFVFDCRLNQIPEDWQKIAVRFSRVNGIRESDKARSIWWMRRGDRCISRVQEWIYLVLLRVEIFEVFISGKSSSRLAVEVGDGARYRKYFLVLYRYFASY